MNYYKNCVPTSHNACLNINRLMLVRKKRAFTLFFFLFWIRDLLWIINCILSDYYTRDLNIKFRAVFVKEKIYWSHLVYVTGKKLRKKSVKNCDLLLAY